MHKNITTCTWKSMMEDELRMDIGYWCLTSNVAPSHHRWAWKVYSFFSPNLPKKWVQKWWKVILLVVFIDGNLKQNYPSPNQGPISWQGVVLWGYPQIPMMFPAPARYFALSRTLPFAQSSVARVLARTVRVSTTREVVSAMDESTKLYAASYHSLL